MVQSYKAYHFTVQPQHPTTEILIAQLAEVGFESFEETLKGCSAYIPEHICSDKILDNLQILNNDQFKIDFTSEIIKPINWNKAWESNFEPIEVNNTVSIRAPFHSKGTLPYNIIIEPKMSFGTGHHETTHLMIEQLLQLDLLNKSLLDMGTGTGVLAILSEMLGANSIDAVDIDPWSFENTSENIERNNSQNVSVYQGDATWLKRQLYDVILANINRNVLLNDMNQYTKNLKQGGVLILSGFYKDDITIISEKANKLKLTIDKTLDRNNWVSLKFIKQ